MKWRMAHDHYSETVVASLPSTLCRDVSARLIQLPYVDTDSEFIDIISSQPYAFSTMHALREVVGGSKSKKRRKRLLKLASDATVQLWSADPVAVNVLATLLSTNYRQWAPEPKVVASLQSLGAREIDTGNYDRIASVEPLAFALSAIGLDDLHRRILERRITNSEW
jgi:hypothetical protein